MSDDGLSNDGEIETAGPVTKRPLISLPFLVVMAVLGIGGYLAGPWLMTQYFEFEESRKANATLDGFESGSERPGADDQSAGVGGGGGTGGGNDDDDSSQD